jgi:phage FluMu protein Com
MLRRFDCPTCNKFLGRSDGSQLETKCARCAKVVLAKPLELQLAVECQRCGRRHHYETPQMRPTYCVACGLDSLTPITYGKRPQEVPTPAEIGATT